LDPLRRQVRGAAEKASSESRGGMERIKAREGGVTSGPISTRREKKKDRQAPALEGEVRKREKNGHVRNDPTVHREAREKERGRVGPLATGGKKENTNKELLARATQEIALFTWGKRENR